VAIGDQVLDMARAAQTGVFTGSAQEAARMAGASELNGLMAMGQRSWIALRHALFDALKAGSPARTKLAECLVPQSQVQYSVPARIGDYTDMYTSVHHATNIGRLFRTDAPLTPNFKWIPIGYHGRVSSIGVSGQTFHRPHGQVLPPGAQEPVFAVCKRLDYELEIGIWIGTGNEAGHPIPVDEAESHIFGLCLLNDWSARDIQAWEYQPLGPFLGKNFATTISPWIVTMAALAPYRSAWTRPASDPQPLAYLDSQSVRSRGAVDMTIEAWIETEATRRNARGPHRLSHSSFRHSYWAIAQMLAHHSIGGCNMQPGDLMGSGTQSGPTAGEAAAMIELSVGGKQAIDIGHGETRTFLQDHDSVIFRAWCEAPGRARIGFGECLGTVLPPVTLPASMGTTQ
jgi:fumarylacetoacetase